MRRILKLIWSGSKKASIRGRSILGLLSQKDPSARSQERSVRNSKELGRAIEMGQPVTFTYLNRGKEEGHRKVFQKKLLRRKETLYCQAFDARRKKYRAFRLDRMSDLKIDLRGKHIR